MFRPKQSMRVLLGLVLPVTLVSQVVSATPVQSRTVQSNVQVVDLRVDGRDDQPVGIDDANPLLAWRMVATPRAALHPCYRSDISVACPTDRQTAYQIQAASDELSLRDGRLIWDSGRVESAVQSGVPYAGRVLASREGQADALRSWESIRILRKPDGSLAYLPMPNGGAPIEFAMVSQDAQSIVFANPAHDFPQRIRYWREGDTLHAEIALIDGSRAIQWSYTPMGG